MKTLLSTLLCSIVFTSVVVAQSEENAIRQCIESESRTFHTNPDRKAFLSYWHISDETRMVYTGPGGSNFITGKDMQNALAQGQFPPVDNAQTVYSNFVIKSSGNIGWASFDQSTTGADGNTAYLHEFRCMEKIDGVWKIISSSVHEYKQ